MFKPRMFKQNPLSILSQALLLAALVNGAPPPTAAAQANPPSKNPQAAQSHENAHEDAKLAPPSDAEIKARTETLLANQHKDDDVLDQYERVERHVDRTSGPNPRTTDDRLYRVVPTGGGTLKILLKDGDAKTDPAAYREQLELWERILEMMADPNSSKAKTAYAKYDKRKRDRAEFADVAAQAYVPRWAGREVYNGRMCDVFDLEHNPEFHPHSMFQDAFVHIAAKVWVDHEHDQLVHAEGRVLSDISFGGGILGKLYKGSFVALDQSEVQPGIWLPTHYQYDFSGRKFLFSFEEHELIDARHYRRVGNPPEALTLVHGELASGKTFDEDP
jgi:hypothetical protein